MEEIYRILDHIDSSVQRDILATIIHVEGSAYRKEGTSMLFREDGTQVGVLSAGCLEEDLSIRVQEMRAEAGPQMSIFDMRSYDDLSWGQGAGCNGVIHVLLEPVDVRLRQHLSVLKFYLQAGKTVMMVRKLTDGFAVSGYLFFVEGQLPFGEWQGTIPNEVKTLQTKWKNSRHKSGLAFIPELDESFYLHCFRPKPRLIVFGAGMDVVPLVKLAAQTGFSVIVCDWRPAFCRESHFPDADQLVIGFPQETVNQLQLTPDDFVMILTHQFQRDQELLQLLVKQKLRYLGVLGSKSRTSRLLGGKEIPDSIYTPVGLPIGAEGPMEIAVSIVSQLIQIYRKRDVGKVISA
ncbi:XdhC family protein [Priestia abyssalis]|uniref:XdhC family protein n=1 Tax=Priestia abyssalis TaxID=1221450 RepID=UPI000995855A|nr:XdhC family protein [Priestia abyssalis]